MATRKPLFFDSTGFSSEEMAATDDILLGGLAMTGNIAMGNNEVTGLPVVPSATAAASKEYVDAIARNATTKQSVKAATTTALPAFTAAGAGVGKTLTADANGAWSSSDSDGVALVAGTILTGDRFLVKDENAGAADVDHGIYVLTQQGDAGTPWILTRANDFDADSEVTAGCYAWVSQGTTQDNTTWAVITNDPITVDTTPIDFTQTQGPGVFSAGDGIEINSGVIAVDLAVTNPCLEFDGSSDLQLKISGTTLQKAAGGVSVLGVPSLFEINGSAVSANVTAANLGTLTAGVSSNADSLHTHPALSTGAVLSEVLTANEAISKGDPVEWGGAVDEIRQCRANDVARVDCIGVAEVAISPAATGKVVYQGAAAGVIAGATVGDRYYVADAGGLISGFAGIAAGNHVILVGTAKNATDLHVKSQYITKKAA